MGLGGPPSRQLREGRLPPPNMGDFSAAISETYLSKRRGPKASANFFFRACNMFLNLVRRYECKESLISSAYPF
jgi:hypothetical protein